jgi:hypothetical protein
MRWVFPIIGLLALNSFTVMEVKSMDGFIGKRVVRSYTQTIHAVPETVFPLLCPVREMEWLADWKCRVIHAPSGLAETNGVYASLHPGESDTIWMITRRDERRHTVEFVYFIPGMRVTRLNIAVHPADGKNSRVEITYIYTGISEAGNREIAENCAEDRFILQMKHWEASMNHFLETGKKLTSHG